MKQKQESVPKTEHREGQGFFEYIQDPVARKLAESLAYLMETQAFDKISTSDILKQSGVSRSTFYRKYRDKYDLLTNNYQLLLNGTIGMIPKGWSYKKGFFQLYKALLGYPSFFKNALSSREPNGLRNYILQQSCEIFSYLLREQGINMEEDYYRLLVRGYVEGALEVTCIWVQQGMKLPLEKLFRISFELMPHEIQTRMALFYM